MATRLAWLLNFDADLRLASDAARPALTSTEVTKLLERVTDLVAEEDAVFGLREPSAHEGLTLLTFCPTPDALLSLKRRGYEPPPAPSLSVLRAVNDRAFCAALGHGLTHSCFARDMPTLVAHLATPSPSGRYVIKRAFSFAGREQRRVDVQGLDPSTHGFCLRSFARGEGVQVEPWVERCLDVSQHGYLTQSGQLLTGQPRVQHCDPMGRFERVGGSATDLSPKEQESLREALEGSGKALYEAGYFGPFGIDGFRYRDDRAEHFNPRCEINARFTMGYPRELLLRGLTADGRRP